MPEDTADASPDEQALASVLRKLERSLNRSPDLDELLLQRPHLASELRDLEAMQHALDQSRPRPDRPMPQQLGEFRIVRRLETGGMGDVYEAWQEPLHRRVAIKVLRHGHHSPSAQERFMREQRVLAQLHQTNIVPIHTAGREGHFEYFAMPFIDGAALRHVVQAAVEFGVSRPGTRTPSISNLISLALAAPKDQRAGSDARLPVAASSHSHAAPRAIEFRPSLEYLRSVATVMADAAQAIQHAHEQGVLHRDIKPSNIMVAAHATAEGRRADQCWVIDFGLASYRSDAHGADPAYVAGTTTRTSGRREDAAPTISGVMGTPAYMAPEQFEGRADERADVWGLGVTLYELLTLRQAFRAPDGGSDAERYRAVHGLVRNVDPPRTRGLIPRDLEAICFRALRKDHDRRYATAGELADDLRRWLRREAVVARCDEVPWMAGPMRGARWATRNKGWATALGAILATISLAVLLGFHVMETGRRDAERAYNVTEAGRRDAERAYQLRELELVDSQPHVPEWSVAARRLAVAIGLQKTDDRLRDAYASTLAGLDAIHPVRREERTSSLAFDGSGDELLLGGAPAWDGRAALRAGSWNLHDPPQRTGRVDAGPVTCRPDGRRVQFVHAGQLDFELWDMTANVPMCAFSLGNDDRTLDTPMINELHLPILALARDGSVVAASIAAPGPIDGDGLGGAVAAWDAGSGRLLGRFPVRATALALAADGRYLATGDALGRITVWALSSGTPVAELTSGHEEVQALAFGANPFGAQPGTADGRDYQLAVGCTSGRIFVWDPVHARVRATCRGMSIRVLSLAFSPDGTLLLAAGSSALLWDSATGTRLLELTAGVGNAAAFSDDGRRIAVASYAKHAGTGSVQVWELDDRRGIRALRGLDTSVGVVAFSPDGRRLAGFSNDWRVGVWDCDTGAPLWVAEAPAGYSGDNAGLAFSGDGTRLACLAGRAAVCWDAASGARLDSWRLPAGLIDKLAFDAQGDLIAARCEPVTFTGLPLERDDSICMVRRLSTPGRTEPLFQSDAVGAKIIDIALDPGGTWVAVERHFENAGVIERTIRAFEIPSGKVLWPLSCNKTTDYACLRPDPTGSFLSYATTNTGNRVLVAMPGGVTVVASDRAQGLGPGAEVLMSDDETPEGLQAGLYHRDSALPFLRLRDFVAAKSVMDRSGNRIACGKTDGLVMLADLRVIQANLRGAGLDR